MATARTLNFASNYPITMLPLWHTLPDLAQILEAAILCFNPSRPKFAATLALSAQHHANPHKFASLAKKPAVRGRYADMIANNVNIIDIVTLNVTHQRIP